MRHFDDKLRIRATSHHGKCSICVRHRLLIKRLPRGPARLSQINQFQRHLKRQFADRQKYWFHRSASRSDAARGGDISTVCIIVDGMDQQKHCYPKSEAMSSKEFHSWARPRMSSSTVIAHGHAVVMGLSPQNTPSSSSRTVELVAYTMTKVLHYVNWTNCFLELEADNCSKELKNQTTLRVFSTMIALHRLRGCQLCFLSSGHSHEDVDAYFALVSSWFDRHKELWDINDFQQCLQAFLANKSVRVRAHEPHRSVVVFDQFHDWILGNKSDEILFFHLKESVTPIDPITFFFLYPRKLHYGHYVSHAHLKGIGGPGAPHVFRLERIRDTGRNEIQ